jgi:sugar phosphate isomerase/epimerase
VTVSLELCSWTVRQASLPELIDLAGRHGFASITTTAKLYARAGLPDSEIRRRLDDAGVTVGYIDGLASPLPGTPEGVTERECFAMAEALGAPAVNVVHFNGSPVPFPQMVDALAGLAGRAGERGLRILIEFLPGTGIPDFPVALELIRTIGDDHAAVMLDTWHLARSGGGPAMLVGDAPGLVGGIQVSDRTAAQDAQPYVPMSGRLMPGYGDLPLLDILAPVLDTHPTLAVGIEVLNDELRSEPAEQAAAGAGRALRSLVDRLPPARG